MSSRSKWPSPAAGNAVPHSATAEGIHAAGHMSCWLVQASLTSDLYTAASQLFEFSAARSPEHSPSRAPISTATHTANHNPPVPTDATGSSSRSRQMLIWPCSLIRIFMLCHMHVSYYKDRRREAGTPTLGHAGLSMSQHVSCTCVHVSGAPHVHRVQLSVPATMEFEWHRPKHIECVPTITFVRIPRRRRCSAGQASAHMP